MNASAEHFDNRIGSALETDVHGFDAGGEAKALAVVLEILALELDQRAKRERPGRPVAM